MKNKNQYQLNIDKLKANELNLVWELENEPYVDISIKHLSGKSIVSDHIVKYDIEKWLEDNINKAIEK